MIKLHGNDFLCLSLFSILICNSFLAQDKQAEWLREIEQFIENVQPEADGEESMLFEQVAFLLETPLDVNREPLDPLLEAGLLSAAEKQAIEVHLLRHGDLLSLYELQAIEILDLETIRRILPLITIQRDLDDYNVPLSGMLMEGKNEIQFQWRRFIELQKGSIVPPDSSSSPFTGRPGRVLFRYRHTYENRFSFGLTAEKDPGEPFFKGKNKTGFDFYSFHIFLQGYRKWAKEIAIGDYRVSLGQGLIHTSGFGTGKGSLVTQIKKNAPGIRPSRSSNESDFLRGAAATFRLKNHLEIGLFASVRNRDASIRTDTSTAARGSIEITNSFTSLNGSGLHRTTTELKNKNTVRHTFTGARIQYANPVLRLNLNAVQHRFDAELRRGNRLYQRFRPHGKIFSNFSIDYSMHMRFFTFFGETALDGRGHIALVSGLQFSPHRNVQAAMLYRRYPKEFHAPVSDPFSETGQSANESGYYLGIEMRPAVSWKISAYMDVWQHPWLRYQADAPSSGSEQLIRIEYQKKRRWSVYAHFRREMKQRNDPSPEARTNVLSWQRKIQVRGHIAYRVTPSLEMRNRLEFSAYRLGNNPVRKGMLMFHDVIFKPMGSPLSGTMRFALFDTDGYDARIYAYENDVIYQFSVPPYSDRGIRYYVNLRYRGIRDLTLELRYARLELLNRATVGSGLNEIAANHRTEIKLQVIYRW